MKNRRLFSFAFIAFLSLGLGVGCSSDSGESDASTGGGEGGGTDVTDVDIPDADDAGDTGVEPDVVVPDVEEDTGGGACIPAQSPCNDTVTCCGGGICGQTTGVCEIRCADEIDCAREVPQCFVVEGCNSAGFCDFSGPFEGPLQVDPIEGDCRGPVCLLADNGVDYRIDQRPDNTDLPADDGIECTVEECVNGAPVRLPTPSICEDDDPNTFHLCIPSQGGCIEGDPPDWYCDPVEEQVFEDEICDGIDNNGENGIDEGCDCVYGDVQPCWPGAPAARGVGGCLDGIQICGVRSDPRWGSCIDAILPSEEVCDNKDNDCNGCADDMPDCSPPLTCPVEQEALPFAFFELNAIDLVGSADQIKEIIWIVDGPSNSEIQPLEDDPETPNLDERTLSVDDPNTEDINEATIPVTRVFLDVSGDYVVTVIIITKKDERVECSWVVRARGQGLRVELKWDTSDETDLDLHMRQWFSAEEFDAPVGTENIEVWEWFQAKDCYFNNQRPSWGFPGTPAEECAQERNCNNPRLDIDNQGDQANRPENINIDNPANGDKYRIMVHAFRLSGFESEKDGAVTVFCGGEQVAVLGSRPDIALMEDDFMWIVADVTLEVDDTGRTTGCIVEPLFVDEQWVIYERDVELP